MAIEPSSRNVGTIDSLQLLTTHYKPTERLFSVTGETSAATALAGRFGATIQANYPILWPETIRGLLIHSASWNSVMRSDKRLSNLTKDEVQGILKIYGYGVPNLDMALWSANNVLTLIAQDSLVPFKEQDGRIKANQMNLHELPWPRDILRDQLGLVDVELRVTLSYFIEPNPTHREEFGKYDYPSHNLRFKLRRATETLQDFVKRINKAAREEDEEFVNDTDRLEWIIGQQNRNHGSIHSDIWLGKGAALAEMDSIAVFPVTGWWKMRKRLRRWDGRARYSLIVTIRTPEENIDIYTPVLNLVQTLTPVQI